MLHFLARLLDNKTLSPHGICFFWRPELLITHVLADMLIGTAYMTIPAGIVVLMRRRKDLPFGWLGWCFTLFITLCGLTHFMSVWTLWHPDYGIEGLLKLVTALVSVATAAALWPLLPLLVRLPTPAHLEAANSQLRSRIAERDIAIAELQHEKAERARVEEALLQSRKMDALGQLTGGIAHDFNNLLTAIRGSVELISRRAADTPGIRKLADGAIEAADRGARLTAQLLTFSRSRQVAAQTLNGADLVANMRDLLNTTLGSERDLRFDLAAEDLLIRADPTQLEMAVLNLVINARDATISGDQVAVSTRHHVAVAGDPDLAPGDYLEIRVSDTGPGMPAEVQARAFEPFFTTKGVGKGTGLGLAQVYGVAKQAGGGARIVSAPGQGTRVSLYIPIDTGPVSAPVPPAHGGVFAPQNRVLKVLVVDDDDDVRAFSLSVMAMFGHGVTEAKDGASGVALAVAGDHDLVLLDFAMPGMNGAEAAAAIKLHKPDLPIIVVTGYADVQAVETALGSSALVLRKPFSISDLEAIMAKALDRDGSASA
jgi:signal transduction histidine kinase/CheY-like chemotaxis protein